VGLTEEDLARHAGTIAERLRVLIISTIVAAMIRATVAPAIVRNRSRTAFLLDDHGAS
jgi:hypothetical protein